MCVAAKQHLLAVGDHAGTLHILEIPWSLRQPTANEVRGGALKQTVDCEELSRKFLIKCCSITAWPTTWIERCGGARSWRVAGISARKRRCRSRTRRRCKLGWELNHSQSLECSLCVSCSRHVFLPILPFIYNLPVHVHEHLTVLVSNLFALFLPLTLF